MIVTDQICVGMLVFNTIMIFRSSLMGKIRRTLTCALALSHLADGDLLPFLVLTEAIFIRPPVKLKIAWGVCLWISLVVTYTWCSVKALPYLALNAYYLVSQFRRESEFLGGMQIDPIFYLLIRSFSEIIKLASLAKHVEYFTYTNAIAPFMACTTMNIVSSRLDASTSLSLLTHAIAAKVPFVVIAKWGYVMFLAHYYTPFYEFNIVAVYMVDALFFIRIWYI